LLAAKAVLAAVGKAVLAVDSLAVKAAVDKVGQEADFPVARAAAGLQVAKVETVADFLAVKAADSQVAKAATAQARVAAGLRVAKVETATADFPPDKLAQVADLRAGQAAAAQARAAVDLRAARSVRRAALACLEVKQAVVLVAAGPLPAAQAGKGPLISLVVRRRAAMVFSGQPLKPMVEVNSTAAAIRARAAVA
jgi:hypothetical protein